MNANKLSVVVPAYNCEKTIKQCIESILGQTIRNIEIIVVDDGSVDNTAQIIKKFSQVKYIYQNNAGPATARNRGCKEAGGNIVFFTDSDCLPQKDWIELAMRHFEDKDVSVVCGSYGIANNENLLARCIHSEIQFRHTHLISETPSVFGSFNFGIRKKVFECVGGFNESYRNASGEDNDLSYKVLKIGGRIIFERRSLVDHYHPSSFVKYMKEQYRHGYWRAQLYKDHLDMAKGDGYTFWKDILEIPLALLIALFTSVMFLNSYIAKLVFFIFAVLVLIEIYYGLKMIKKPIESFVMAAVMIARAFARAFGFVYGLIRSAYY